jgi:XRE family transcriptional regulator, aerobic/anaerobic benzoate catabolism transcriptional regulator
MNPLLRALGQRLRALREEHGLTLETLAQRSRLSVRFVSEVLAGRANISVTRLARIAAAVGSSAGTLLADAERTASATASAPVVVALLGIRGAGKSAIGERLAARLGVQFVELDRRIEAQAGLSLAEIFALHGEAYYRRLELDALGRLLGEERPTVIAVGGGLVTNPPAFEMLAQRTVTVWLRASLEDHWRRVVRQGDPRPMAGRPAARAELRKLIAEREPLYRRAAIRIDTTRLGLARSVDALVERLSGRVAEGPARSPAARRAR